MSEVDLSGSVDGWTPMPYRGDVLERSYARRGARLSASNHGTPGLWLSPMARHHSTRDHSRNNRSSGDMEMGNDDDGDSDNGSENDAGDSANLLGATSSSEEEHDHEIDDASLIHRCGCTALVSSRRYRRRAVPWCFVLSLGATGWWFLS